MSYIRASYPLRYVDGISNDYVFCSDEYIEDYGKISNEGLIEILSERWITDDDLLKNYILQKLAKRLNVKLREKPLTVDEWWNLVKKDIRDF